jgi:hypothetical protein
MVKAEPTLSVNVERWLYSHVCSWDIKVFSLGDIWKVSKGTGLP